eukprot:s2725_g14.t1
MQPPLVLWSQLLLQAKAMIHAADTVHAESALHMAIRHDRRLVKVLHAKADPQLLSDSVPLEWETQMTMACRSGFYEMTTLLSSSLPARLSDDLTQLVLIV